MVAKNGAAIGKDANFPGKQNRGETHTHKATPQAKPSGGGGGGAPPHGTCKITVEKAEVNSSAKSVGSKWERSFPL